MSLFLVTQMAKAALLVSAPIVFALFPIFFVFHTREWIACDQRNPGDTFNKSQWEFNCFLLMTIAVQLEYRWVRYISTNELLCWSTCDTLCSMKRARMQMIVSGIACCSRVGSDVYTCRERFLGVRQSKVLSITKPSFPPEDVPPSVVWGALSPAIEREFLLLWDFDPLSVLDRGEFRILVGGPSGVLIPGGPWAQNLLKIAWKLLDFEKILGAGGPVWHEISELENRNYSNFSHEISEWFPFSPGLLSMKYLTKLDTQKKFQGTYITPSSYIRIVIVLKEHLLKLLCRNWSIKIK